MSFIMEETYLIALPLVPEWLHDISLKSSSKRRILGMIASIQGSREALLTFAFPFEPPMKKDAPARLEDDEDISEME